MSSLKTRFAGYKEEMEMSLSGEYYKNEELNLEDKITVLDANIKKYIPNIEEQDLANFVIVEGELYYIGNDETQKQVAISQNIKVLEEDESSFLDNVEIHAVEMVLRENNGNIAITDASGNSIEKGEALKNKGLSTTDWKIVVEIVNNATVTTYGTGWYYVKAGNTVEGLGTLRQSYMIDYENRKAVRFEEAKHAYLKYGENLAVNDASLVLNIDPINMASGDVESWVDAECVGFTPTGDYDENGNLKSGWTGTAIRFDGEDDYIQFYGGGDFSKGYTISFYGASKESIIYPLAKQNQNSSYSFRVAFVNDHLSFNLTKRAANSSWSTYGLGSNETKYNTGNGLLGVFFEKNYELEKGVYFDLVFDPSVLEYSLFVNGEFIDSTTVAKMYWLTEENETAGYGGIDILQDENLPYRIGCQWGGVPAMWRYMTFDLYCVRMYNRPLSYEELMSNYTATTAYHNILAGGGTAETSGETGGNDF